METDPDTRILNLGKLFFLALLAVVVRHLSLPGTPTPRLLPGPADILIDSRGLPVSLAHLLPPDGSGTLLLFRLQDPVEVLRAVRRAWRDIIEKRGESAVAVLITRRKKGVRNLARWLGMKPLLRMHPETFHSRFRIQGLPAVILLDHGRIASSRLVYP